MVWSVGESNKQPESAKIYAIAQNPIRRICTKSGTGDSIADLINGDNLLQSV